MRFSLMCGSGFFWFGIPGGGAQLPNRVGSSACIIFFGLVLVVVLVEVAVWMCSLESRRRIS